MKNKHQWINTILLLCLLGGFLTLGIKHATTGAGLKVTNTVWSENHTIDGDVLPDTNNAYDLGSAALTFQQAYINALFTSALRNPTALYFGLNSPETNRVQLNGLNGTSFYFAPVTDNQGGIGTTSKAWNSIFAYDAISKTQTTGLSFKWKDTPEQALYLDDADASSGDWTDCDLTAYTSANAKMALLQLYLFPSIIGGGDYTKLGVRKNGLTPTYTDSITVDSSIPASVGQYAQVIVGLDSGQVIEYFLTCGAGWTVDAAIRVMGYWE